MSGGDKTIFDFNFLLIQYFWTKLLFDPNFSLLKVCFHFNFFNEKVFGPKSFWTQNFWTEFFWIQTYFGSEILLDQKNFRSKIFKFPKILKYICTQIFWTQIFLL